MLQIDPNTPKGQAQLEAIGWAQDQMNQVLLQYFQGKIKVVKGLQFHFVLRTDLVMNEKIKVEIAELLPKTAKDFEEGVQAFKETLTFQEDPNNADKKGAIIT